MRSSIQKTLIAYTLAKFISLKISYGSFNLFQLDNFIQFIIPEMMKNENKMFNILNNKHSHTRLTLSSLSSLK